jgi:ubiquinol-cytochrome c reductase cytochrome c subunit
LSLLSKVILLALVLTAMTVGAQSPQTKNPSGNAVKGKELYTRGGCYECHGRAGQGSILSGPRVGPDPIPFSALVSYVRQPRGQMPPYTRKVMSDAELADIYAFLQTLPKPTEVKDILILNTQSK